MINTYRIVENSFVDGPGKRVTVFVKGCEIGCPSCQSVHLWSPDGGTLYDEDELAMKVAKLAEDSDGVTVSGGEPFAQAKAVAFFVKSLRKYGVKHIIIYSGYTFEQLINPVTPVFMWVTEILVNVDVLVDGPFIKALDHDRMQYRGSGNQRVIDVPATLEAVELTLLDWDTPELEITPDGNVVLPIGLAKEFSAFGKVERTRMCGSSKF